MTDSIVSERLFAQAREALDSGPLDQSFEFTHRTFREFLTASRLVRAIEETHERLTASGDADRRWNLDQALGHWVEVCGPSPIDHYLLEFLRSELTLRAEKAKLWTVTTSALLEHLVTNGPPLEALADARNVHELEHTLRNTRTAILATANATAGAAGERTRLAWPSRNALGDFLLSIVPQRSPNSTATALECLTHLDAAFQNLACSSLRLADLSNGNFAGCNFDRANLSEADFSSSGLRGASFVGADLRGAKLNGARMEEACLTGADLSWADLTGARLAGANIEGARFEGAKTEGAVLPEALVRRLAAGSVDDGRQK